MNICSIFILLILGLMIGSVPAYDSENNATNIAKIIDSYNARVSWDDSVPRLNWKANEASMNLLQICALLAENFDIQDTIGKVDYVRKHF